MKVWKKNIIVLTISVLIFGSYTVKSLIDYRSLLHESVHGVIIDCTYDKTRSTYLYHTNKGKTLNSSHFFKEKSGLKLDISDYIIKFPHSPYLYVLNLREDGDYYLKDKLIGHY